jgi:glycosyltransferase involved in cell wall biosynthesis
MKKTILVVFLLNSSIINNIMAQSASAYGFIKFANGIGRHTISFIDNLLEYTDINFIETRPISTLKDCPNTIKSMWNNKKSNNEGSRINFFLDNLYADKEFTQDQTTQIDSSKLNFCISTCESDKIPNKWVCLINKKFDAVLVPDEYHLKTYRECGVIKPIFYIPFQVFCKDLLSKIPRKKKSNQFTIGSLGAFSENKNFAGLIDAFNLAFQGNQNYTLKIHSYWDNYDLRMNLLKKIHKLGLHNVVSITYGELSNEEIFNFYKNIDCYAQLSSGEGFSFTPREALALGLPVVLSNNTAHMSICKTGLVYPVICPIAEKSMGEFVGPDTGNWFKIDVSDAAQKMIAASREKYDKNVIHSRKKYASSYLKENLSDLYRQLITPDKLILGNENKILRDGIITSDEKFIMKFKKCSK